jgi:hypothetical protein
MAKRLNGMSNLSPLGATFPAHFTTMIHLVPEHGDLILVCGTGF